MSIRDWVFFLFLTWRTVLEVNGVDGDEGPGGAVLVTGDVDGDLEGLEVAPDLERDPLPPVGGSRYSMTWSTRCFETLENFSNLNVLQRQFPTVRSKEAGLCLPLGFRCGHGRP